MQITYKSTVQNNKKQQTNKKRDKEVDRINAEYDGMMTHWGNKAYFSIIPRTCLTLS